MRDPIRVGIVGAAGYTAGELLRLLLRHPYTNIVWAHSQSSAGKPVSAVHHDLLGDIHLQFSEKADLAAVDAVFLCSGHGQARAWLDAQQPNDSLLVIDLGNDFRTEPRYGNRRFVYGLPELQREVIHGAASIANPGCFATAIQHCLLPLAAAELLQNAVHVSGITGSTGAGQAFSETSHFSWRSNNASTYKVFTHQHLAEVRQSLSQVSAKSNPDVYFVPYRGPFTRGILVTAYTPTVLSDAEARQLYKSYYAPHPFVVTSDAPPDLKTVVNTNKSAIHVQVLEGQLVATCAIDNLLKGASGQAVQNLNLAVGLPETTGLQLKASAF